MTKKKPQLVVFNNNYPRENNRYADVFVHSRLKYYANFFNVNVVGWNKRTGIYSFTYEGIHVDMVDKADLLVEKIFSYKPDVLAFHFVEGWQYRSIIKPFKGPSLIWIHGGEALGWYRRLFMFRLNNPIPFIRYVARNTIQMFQMHQLITYSNLNPRVKLIFVSKWMKGITELDTLSQSRNFRIIPNPIDGKLFQYRKKDPQQRTKILLIRSFESKKYANDLAIDAILQLSKYPFFNELSFSIYGVGRYYKRLTKKIAHFKNVSLHNTFLENKDIPAVHAEHGIFLCPTRQDAQGVSMCEAMSSGLVPISSRNTAIPEFLEQNVTGIMTTSPAEIAEAIAKLYANPDQFLSISEAAANRIQQISGTDSVVSREIELIQTSVSSVR
ncbi:MAG: glycosyltransferase family 4 protein [Bacteroidota bacterium]